MTCIANYALSQNLKFLNCREFIATIDSFSDLQIDALAHLIDANRMTVHLYQGLEYSDSQGACRLKSRLKSSFEDQIGRKLLRDLLLRKLITTFEDMSIDYVVFKSLNSSGWIGVDIDVMIAPSDYDLCVKILLKNGFYSIDDLAKRYATGFMIRGNPIVVDLHTELAILGVRYLSADLLLQNSKCVTVSLFGSQGLDSLVLNTPNETVEALARIAHSILKEGIITLGDFQEVYRVPMNSIIDYIAKEGLQLSASVFAYESLYLQNTEQFADLLMFQETLLHYIAKDILISSIEDAVPPFKIPTAVCALAFIDHLKTKGELGRCAPTLLHSLKFSRNAAHIGHKLFERFFAG